jgi:2-methylisocitrate lyase-like PEP mutase family enzyme
LKAARRAIDETGADVLLTARAEAFLTGHPTPLAEAVTRFRAFAKAGADVLYAPGPRKPGEIAALVAAAEGLPVNVIVFADVGLSVADIAALGARRISIGSALAKAAFTAFDQAAERIARDGLFNGFAGNMGSAAINDFFAEDMKSWSAGKARA